MWWCMGEFFCVQHHCLCVPTQKFTQHMCSDPPGYDISHSQNGATAIRGTASASSGADCLSGRNLSGSGGTVRPVSDRSLCLTATGHFKSNPIRLRDCDNNDSDQKFDGFHDNGRFELHPRDDSGLCVSQLHHPKKAETVYLQDCRDTRDHEVLTRLRIGSLIDVRLEGFCSQQTRR